MGAMEFTDEGSGKTATEAFDDAVGDAAYEYGHGGYTGTIAEKCEFRELALPEGTDAYKFAQDCLDDENHFCQDKWGAAACVRLSDRSWLFFGWASS